MTRPVGEIFNLKNVLLQVVENKVCRGCYFESMETCIGLEITGDCSEVLRDKKQSVIFKKVEK